MHIISRVEAKNFGTFEHMSQDYVDGAVVARGSNGSGKTTAIAQVPLYGLFGTSTLDAPISDTVREGSKDSTMEVTVQLGPYTVKRSKASASVTGPGIQISGQKEVSEFFYKLLGISPGAEEAVLWAKQGATAGVLTAKAGEVNSIIEELAGFKQIDDLIENVKVKYPSGFKSILEDNLKTAQDTLEELGAKVMPDVPAMTEDLTKKQLELDSFEKPMVDIRDSNTKSKEQLKKLIDNNHAIELLEIKMNNKAEVHNAAEKALKTLQEKKYQQFDLAELGKATALVENVAEATKVYDLYQRFLRIATIKDFYGGPEKDAREALKADKAAVKKLELEISEKTYSIGAKRKAMKSVDICPECGANIKEKNEELNAARQVEIDQLTAEIKILEAEKKISVEYVVKMESAIQIQDKNSGLRLTSDHIEVDTSVTPNKFLWKSLDIPMEPDQAALNTANKLLAAFEAEKATMERDQKQQEELAMTIKNTARSYGELLVEVEALGVAVDTQPLLDEINKAAEELFNLTKQRSAKLEEVNQADKALALAKNEVENHKKVQETAKVLIKDIRGKIVTDARNGKMLKSVRDAKPKVIDLLWARVLEVVSQTHSSMLGRGMKIEKGAKGFAVNGRSVGRLSGAEKSTLGIALRDALRSIFAPGCGFLILDEPFSDCDSEVTLASIAAIQSIPGQKFVISHEDNSEVFADQIVEFSRGE